MADSTLRSSAVSALEEKLNEASRALAAEETVPPEVERAVSEATAEIVKDLSGSIDDIDPYLLVGLLHGSLLSVMALNQEDAGKKRKDMRLSLERLRHAVRDLAEGLDVREDVSSKSIAAWLIENLDLSQAEIAELVNVSTRQLQRWASPSYSAKPRGDDVLRLRIVARVMNNLRHAMTSRGAYHWLTRVHPELKGDSPLKFLEKNPDEGPFVVHLSSSARSFSAV